MARHLRYHHMTEDYVANIISLSRLMYKSGLLPVAVQRSFVHRKTQAEFLKQHQIHVPPNRGAGGSWEIQTEVRLTDLLGMQKGQAIYQLLGIVGGYPVYVRYARHLERDTLAMAFGLIVLDPNNDSYASEEDKHILPPGR